MASRPDPSSVPSLRDYTVDVVEAVAERDGVPPTSLRPLHEAVDAEALGRLLASGSPTNPVTVRFEYAGYDVLVASDGTVDVA